MALTGWTRPILAAVALAAIAMPSGIVTAQAGPPPALVVHAAHSGTGRLVLTSAIRLPEYQDASLPAGVESTTGNFSAIVIYRGNQLVYGLAVDNDIGFPVTWGLIRPTLLRGTYTVIVVTQRAVTFTLPLPASTRTYRVTASKPTTARRVYTDANPGPLAELGSTSVPLQVTADTALMTMYIVDRTLTVADFNDFCLSRKSGSCADGDIVEGNNGGQDVGFCPGCRDTQGFALYPHAPQSVAPGSYYIVADDTDVGTGENMRIVTYYFG